ncbi:hypothetical protein RRG08_048234 [Elysia crispata]|uniref:Uncharacterized protein n=1 Tax=Elysia crispata TaxID=231223 RepID=A0AAE0Y054_9GAST|nr:hypothetical protein RRG08_048234 [Elysia crispata]
MGDIRRSHVMSSWLKNQYSEKFCDRHRQTVEVGSSFRSKEDTYYRVEPIILVAGRKGEILFISATCQSGLN